MLASCVRSNGLDSRRVIPETCKSDAHFVLVFELKRSEYETSGLATCCSPRHHPCIAMWTTTKEMVLFPALCGISMGKGFEKKQAYFALLWHVLCSLFLEHQYLIIFGIPS